MTSYPKRRPENTQLTVPKPTPKPASGEEKTETAQKPVPVEAKKESKGPQPENKVSKGAPRIFWRARWLYGANRLLSGRGHGSI